MFTITNPSIFRDPPERIADALSQLLRSLDRCRLLEEMTLGGTVPQADGQPELFDPLVDRFWPLLRKLDISCALLGSQDGGPLATFVSRHQALEQLRLSDIPIRASFLARTPLKVLANLDLDIDFYLKLPMDVLTILPSFPTLRYLRFRDQNICEVLSAARGLRSKVTRRALNAGHMGEWENIVFPVIHVEYLESWARYFKRAATLQTVVLRCNAGQMELHEQVDNHDERPYQAARALKEEETSCVSLVDIFSRTMPSLLRVDSKVESKGTLDLWLTCYRKDVANFPSLSIAGP
ncbi:hypothetical protein CALVIDRAFT_538866 [Calocera viscosa TUFC12733]|uniref:F-box domain-containing protein n=1 Tax=Calocera viscosa (strain TUFC12733) TaxID=1330018 RepID=A0A167KL84_CALVF|nr:hypothetical protein CALVIDRAFT_538866 [Calocera viscosa TUFC12733]